MTKYNVSPLVAREIEFSTGTIFGGSWCRYFISITLHQCYIEATWKTRPKNDLDGNKEIFNSLQEIITGLKKHLREFIQDNEQDEDMISQYNAIEKWESDHRETEIFQQLAVSELFNQLNK